MFKSFKKNEKGFTLVELVVVIAILAILAALLVPRIMGNVEDANHTTEVANARTLAGQITTHNALATVNGTATIPATLPASGTVTLQSATPATLTTYYDDSLYGELPDGAEATILVDTDGNASVNEIP